VVIIIAAPASRMTSLMNDLITHTIKATEEEELEVTLLLHH